MSTITTGVYIHKLATSGKQSKSDVEMVPITTEKLTGHPDMKYVPAGYYSWAKFLIPTLIGGVPLEPQDTTVSQRDLRWVFEYGVCCVADLLRDHSELYITAGAEYLAPVLLSPEDDWNNKTYPMKPEVRKLLQSKTTLLKHFAYAQQYQIDIPYEEDTEQLLQIARFIYSMLADNKSGVYYTIAIAKYSQTIGKNVVMIKFVYFDRVNKYAPPQYKADESFVTLFDKYATDHIRTYNNEKIRLKLRGDLERERYKRKK